MRIAMTLVVRDEADIVETWLRYHLARGVDVVIATDHKSVDGTSEILHEYARNGRVVVRREESDVLRQAEWVTRMDRVAAEEHGADWVIPSDADELWWPRAGSFAEILDAVPRRYGVVRGLMRHFVFRPGNEPPFERLTVRARSTLDLGSPYHAQVKVAHRGTQDVEVSVGNHDARGTGLRLVRDWFPFEVLHFPIRSERQLEDKFRRRATSPDGQHIVRALELLERGGPGALVAESIVDDAALAAGLSDGSLVRDVRLRDALRSLGPDGLLAPTAPLTPSDDVDLAVDTSIALVHDALAVTEARCIELEHRVAALEGHVPLVERLARYGRRVRPDVLR